MSEIYICQLPDEVQNYASSELHETEDSRRKSLDDLKKWASENPQFHVRTGEKHILPFLRCCKFDLDRTKEKLKKFYIMRSERSEWFSNRNPMLPEIQELVKMGCTLALRETHENKLVFIVRPTLHDPKVHTMDNIIKTALMVLDIAVMEEELSQVYGVIAIVDLTNVGLGHAKQLSVSRVKHLVHAWQNYHCRPKRIQFINAPAYVNIVLNIFKKFMSEKLKNRVHIRYDGDSSLTGIIDKAILPRDYGGEGETLENLASYWNDKMISYKDWFIEDGKYKADVK